jgi:hypothetical protein
MMNEPRTADAVRGSCRREPAAETNTPSQRRKKGQHEEFR